MDQEDQKTPLNTRTTTTQAGQSHNRRPHRRDAPESREVQISKACSYILRHGVEKEGIKMRSDGYVKVDDLVRCLQMNRTRSHSPPNSSHGLSQLACSTQNEEAAMRLQ